MAKKTKQSDRERDGFLFDEGAGTEQELIDLFNDAADGETETEYESESEPTSGADRTDMPLNDGDDKIPPSVSSVFRFDRY